MRNISYLIKEFVNVATVFFLLYFMGYQFGRWNEKSLMNQTINWRMLSTIEDIINLYVNRRLKKTCNEVSKLDNFFALFKKWLKLLKFYKDKLYPLPSKVFYHISYSYYIEVQSRYVQLIFSHVNCLGSYLIYSEDAEQYHKSNQPISLDNARVNRTLTLFI